jgi:pimeloyl-ACP methyl ester carboxylesterase
VLLRTPAGELEYVVYGDGAPVTIFAHGLGGAIAETRPLASGVGGTRVFLHFPGHGASFRPAEPAGYPELAADLAAVADHVGATRALGVSMGAAALLHVAARQPRRFERLVFFLPSVIDQVRSPQVRGTLRAMAAAIDAGTMADFVRNEIPERFRDTGAGQHYVRTRSAALAGLADMVRAAEDQVAVADRSAITKIEAPALVIGAAGDPLHDVAVARELAGLLPDARLHVFDGPPLWTHRAELRELISGFLS